MASPTQRTLKRLRDAGWFCAVVEKWNPHAKIRQDLYGFIDVLAFKGDTILAVQCTSGANVAARKKKIMALPMVIHWLASDTRKIEVWGWSKQGPRGKRKTWQYRSGTISLSDVVFQQVDGAAGVSPAASLVSPVAVSGGTGTGSGAAVGAAGPLSF